MHGPKKNKTFKCRFLHGVLVLPLAMPEKVFMHLSLKKLPAVYVYASTRGKTVPNYHY